MTTNERTTSTPDVDLIGLGQIYEIRDWCKKLNCTEAQLREAIKKVGPVTKKVGAYLASKSA